MNDREAIKAIEAELGKPIPVKAFVDLDWRERGCWWEGERLTSLSLPDCQFNLKKLRGCTHLKKLQLPRTKISDLAPLSHLTALTYLDLDGTQISDLTPLNPLTALTTLILGGNQISDLTPLAHLNALTHLDLNVNQISDLTPLNSLNALTYLNLGGNQISDLTPLNPLYALTDLILYNNQISDLTPLNSLTALTLLALDDNQISDLSPLNPLTALTHLHLRLNQISDLTPLNPLTALTYLNLQGNQISDLTPLNHLTALTLLNLQNNQISDLTPLNHLTALTHLDLAINQISDLTPLNPLTALTSLYLSHNRITTLSKEFLQLSAKIQMDKDWMGIALADNPLIHPPPEIVRRGREAIAAFFDTEGEARKLNEAKLILVGEGGTGKTSLVKRLMSQNFDPIEEVTHGILINTWTFEHQDNTVLTRIWDFGGQEIMHATHQFFLSERAIYLVLLDCRKDQRPEYWLKCVANFGGDSPVIVVLNKIDQNPGFDVDRAALTERYPQIVGFYRTSCFEDTGIDQLRDEVQNQLNRAELCRSSWPESWYGVKQALENESRPYLDQPSFRQLVQTHKVRQEHADILIDLMHDLGLVIHFRDLHLNNVYLLSPLWVIRGVYALLSAPEPAASGGNLTPDDLSAILTRITHQMSDGQPSYPPETHGFILKLMQKFELAYEQDNGNLLIPDLLPKGRPDLPRLAPSPLRFRANYRFLAPGTLPRFMVKRHRDIVAKWRTGVVLKHHRSDTQALVLEDTENRRLTLSLHGATPSPYLEILRDTLAQIQIGAHWPMDEEMACRCTSCESSETPTYFNLNVLITRLLAGLESDYCILGAKPIFIKELLSNIYPTNTIKSLTALANIIAETQGMESQNELDYLLDDIGLSISKTSARISMEKIVKFILAKRQPIQIQDLIHQGKLAEALRQIQDENQTQLVQELAFLHKPGFDFPKTLQSLSPTQADRLKLWLLLSEHFTPEFKVDSTEQPSSNQLAPEIETHQTPKTTSTSTQHAQAKGQQLEHATLALFQQFFALTEDQLNPIRERLQGSGDQRGHDLEFEFQFKATPKHLPAVRCHVECKNYHTPLAIEKINDKLMQEYALGTDLDHWILISPHTDPHQRMDEILTGLAPKLPFSVQIWSPQHHVDQFFQLHPPSYREIYGKAPPTLTAEQKSKIKDQWLQKLNPKLRLPPGFERIQTPDSEFFNLGGDLPNLEDLYQNHITPRCTNDGNLLQREDLHTLTQTWLQRPETPFFLLLGEFGSGKSFFTYCLTRNQAANFLKDPQTQWFPLRLTLNQYTQTTDPETYLNSQLNRLNADLKGLHLLRRTHPLLLILDGFDEMTRNLDHDAIHDNLKIISGLFEFLDTSPGQPYKVLMTSRPAFFKDQWFTERLYEQIGKTPLTYHTAPFERNHVIQHLREVSPQVTEQVLIMFQEMNDPIGLAEKALFLDMVKVSLSEWINHPPRELEEVDLYQTYIHQVLAYKEKTLHDPERRTLLRDTKAAIHQLLHQIARDLHQSNQTFIDLQRYKEGPNGVLAEILWKDAQNDHRQNAVNVLATRSLFHAAPQTHNATCWPVKFCHRSIKEYFVAAALVRDLEHDLDQAQKFLEATLLNPEIAHFTISLLLRGNKKVLTQNLHELLRKTHGPAPTGYLGGNALTLYHRIQMDQDQPLAHFDGRALNLNHAFLLDADLSGLDFTGADLSNANLNNTRLNHTNFTQVDLTGARFEETPAVTRLLPNGAHVLAVYKDGSIRNWSLADGHKRDSDIWLSTNENRPTWIHPRRTGELDLATQDTLHFYDAPHHHERRQSGVFPRHRQIQDLRRRGNHLALHIQAEAGDTIVVLDLSGSPANLRDHAPRAIHRLNTPILLWEFDEHGRLFILTDTLYLAQDRGLKPLAAAATFAPHISAMALTAADDTLHLALGHQNGRIHLYRFKATFSLQAGVAFQAHKGTVSALAFCGSERLISAGVDSELIKWSLDHPDGPLKAARYTRTLQCRGLTIQGARRPKIEAKRLADLIARDQPDPQTNP